MEKKEKVKKIQRQSLYMSQRIIDFLGSSHNVTQNIEYISEGWRYLINEASKTIQQELDHDEILACCVACRSTAFPHESGSSPTICINKIAADLAGVDIQEIEIAVPGFTNERRKALVKKLSKFTTVQDFAFCEIVAAERKRLSISKKEKELVNRVVKEDCKRFVDDTLGLVRLGVDRLSPKKTEEAEGKRQKKSK